MEGLNQILDQVFRPGTFAVAVAVVIFTFFTRKIVERLVPATTVGKKEAKIAKDGSMLVARDYGSAFGYWWNEVILHAIPVLAGGLFGIMPSEFLHGAADTLGARLMWCAGVGWFSSFLYKLIAKALGQRAGVEVSTPSMRPLSPDDPAPPEEPSPPPDP